jgi:hypothetical protein
MLAGATAAICFVLAAVFEWKDGRLAATASALIGFFMAGLLVGTLQRRSPP